MRARILILMLASCTPTRPVVEPAELEARREAFFEGIAAEAADAAAVVRRRLERHANGDVAGAFDILILSGGGAKGAFGAGFLQGWSRDAGRPVHFDVVTGVSTGALLAPFAFVGTQDAIQRVVDTYEEPKPDWVVSRTLSFLFQEKSYLDASGLHRDLRATMDEQLVRAVGEGHRDDRLLLIGTTDLDLGVMRTWNLTLLADQGKQTRFEDVLLASSAIPGAFPPIEIDGNLYVDGGVSAQFVNGIDVHWVRTTLREIQSREPGWRVPPIRFWVIINNKLTVTPTTTRPTWPSVAGRSIDVMIRQSMNFHRYSYILEARSLGRELGVPVEVRYVTIPNDHPEPAGKSFFDKEVMEGLVQLGRRMGADAKSWRREIDNPEYPHPHRTPLLKE
ncbi:MAG: patatin-like phospholipase family protein [Planctomycetota bacterium]